MHVDRTCRELLSRLVELFCEAGHRVLQLCCGPQLLQPRTQLLVCKLELALHRLCLSAPTAEQQTQEQAMIVSKQRPASSS